MKKGDCDGAVHRSVCLAAYANQRLGRLKAHYSERIGQMSPDVCDADAVRVRFEAREAAWEQYAERHCDLQLYCDDAACGSGQSGAASQCHATMLLEQVARLEAEMRSGTLDLWGCSITLQEQSLRLVTDQFTITLAGQCDLGLFDCDKIAYHGVDKRTGNVTRLNGSEELACSWEPLGCEHIGYRFEHGDAHYSVSRSGLLRVSEASTGSVLLEEQGIWE